MCSAFDVWDPSTFSRLDRGQYYAVFMSGIGIEDIARYCSVPVRIIEDAIRRGHKRRARKAGRK